MKTAWEFAFATCHGVGNPSTAQIEEVEKMYKWFAKEAYAEGYKAGQEAMRERIAMWKTSQLETLEIDASNPFWERDFFARKKAIEANKREAQDIRSLPIEEPAQ